MYGHSCSLGTITCPRCCSIRISTRCAPATDGPRDPYTPVHEDGGICDPGDSSRSHSANEYISTDEIRTAIDTYLHVLQGLHF